MISLDIWSMTSKLPKWVLYWNFGGNDRLQVWDSHNTWLMNAWTLLPNFTIWLEHLLEQKDTWRRWTRYNLDIKRWQCQPGIGETCLPICCTVTEAKMTAETHSLVVVFGYVPLWPWSALDAGCADCLLAGCCISGFLHCLEMVRSCWGCSWSRG